MTLHDLILNSEPLTPWAEGKKIPWDDPEFSARMLSEHLSQNHNAASRRTDKIDQHTSWIHHHILHERCGCHCHGRWIRHPGRCGNILP